MGSMRRALFVFGIATALACGSGGSGGRDSDGTVTGTDSSGSSDTVTANDDRGSGSTTTTTEPGGTSTSGADTSTGDDDGPFVPPPGTECAYGFFSSYFDEDNGPEHADLRDLAFAHIVQRVEELQACGAGVTLGGLLSLMIFEGGGAPVAFFNDRCSENSYDASATCWTVPIARYSYQYGLAPMHTSNFHPCADVGWTSMMRARLLEAATAAGFSATPAEIESVAAELQTICPGANPTAVDYWILAAHDVFGVPTDTAGNDLAHAGTFPFFEPRVMIDLFFDALEPTSASLVDDNTAIAVFGGGEASSDDPAKQAMILALWEDWQAEHCPLRHGERA
jgi:hypothetical protein